jgi:hypothetical protein
MYTTRNIAPATVGNQTIDRVANDQQVPSMAGTMLMTGMGSCGDIMTIERQQLQE